MSKRGMIMRSEIDVFGSRLMMEHFNGRKTIGVKLLNSRRMYESLKSKINLRNPIGLLILLEFGNFYLNEIKNNDNCLVKHFKQNTITDYFVNIGIYMTVGRLLYAFKKPTALSIIPIGLAFNYFDYTYLPTLNKRIGDFLNLENFDLITQKNIIPKLYLAFGLTYNLKYILERKWWYYRGIKVMNRQSMTMFFSFFFITRITKYLSYLTSDSIKYKYFYLV
jgi:hypothetical protein